ncbi:MAG: hypothetical protein U9O97_02305, partial [Elusimicrobiota bacterium]|nr:hypothetical protein [Elusimicrobiota bacterium]
SGTGEIESYSIPGLRKGVSYTVVLPMGEEALFMAPESQYITQDEQTYNFIFQDNAPLFISWIKKSSNVVTIEAFASEPLRESVGSDVVVLDEIGTLIEDVQGTCVVVSTRMATVISSDKIDISASFEFGEDENYIKYHFEGTDLKGNRQSPAAWASANDKPESEYPFSYTFYKDWDNYAQKNINPTFGGSVEVGNGDNSEVYVPTGSMDTSEDIKVTVGKTKFPSESVPESETSIPGIRSSAAVKAYVEKRDSFYTARYGAAMPSFDGPELAVSTGSALYEVKARLVSGPLASIAASQAVDLTFEYDPSISTYPATDNIYVYSSTASSNAEWNLVDTTPVINTTDNTVTVQTSHFSYFAVFKLSAVPSVTVVSPTVTSVSPASGAKGTTIPSVTITGTGFKDGVSVSLSPVGMSVSSVTRVSATQLTAWNVVIAAGAATGARNLTATNSDGGYGTLADAFFVNSSSTTVNVSTVTCSGTVTPGNTIILTVTGTGLDNFNDEPEDVIKLDNASEGYFITGSTIAPCSTTTLTVQFVIPVAAPAGSYDLQLDDNTGEYLMRSAVVTITANPYADAFKTYAFPNPCRANSLSIKVCVPGTAAEVSAGTTVNGEVRIYTITGEQVWSASQSLKKAYGPGDTDPSWGGKNIINWDLKNSNGGNVSSGVYFYIVEVAGQGRDKGKIAIIR